MFAVRVSCGSDEELRQSSPNTYLVHGSAVYNGNSGMMERRNREDWNSSLAGQLWQHAAQLSIAAAVLAAVLLFSLRCRRCLHVQIASCHIVMSRRWRDWRLSRQYTRVS